jgi:DNA-directed RNA polymerase subunit M/transcription elongation factor TFIIS
MTEELPTALTCPKCGAALVAAADLQSSDMLRCPKHGDVGTLQELMDQSLQRQMENAVKEALKKADD